MEFGCSALALPPDHLPKCPWYLYILLTLCLQQVLCPH